MIEIYWPDVLVFSHSRIKSWRRCQMQHHYRYYQRLRKKLPSRPLKLGTAVHKMIEAQHERGTWKPEFKQFVKEYNRLFAEERAELGDLPTELEGIIKGYFSWYKKDGLYYPKRRRNRSTEIEVRVDLDAHTQFLGFIDAFPQDAEGRNWVMDHKTCRTIPDEDTRFADLQLVVYQWLLPQLGYPKPDGVIWDYLRTKAPAKPQLLKNGELSKRKNIDTTYDVYMSTVEELLGEGSLADYEEFAQTLKGKEDNFYRRIPLPHPSDKLVDSVVEDLLSTIKEIREKGPTAQVRNMTKDCKFCPYYNLCQAEVRGLDSDYIRKTEYYVKEKE